MRILILNCGHFRTNGMAAVIRDYYTAMDKEGFEFDFITTNTLSEYYEQWFKDRDLKCTVVMKSNPLKYFFKLKKVVKQGNYDLVHIHGNSANMAIELMACAMAGIKFRLTHVHNTITRHPLTNALLYPIFSALCTERLACGQDAGKWLYGKKPFTELKNGRSVERFSYNAEKAVRMKEQLGLTDKVVIGHVGLFSPQKNHTFLMDVCRSVLEKNPDARFLLLGEGALRAETEEKAKRLGVYDSIIFAGAVSNPEDYLNAMDAAVLPSLFEGLPLVAVEWQINGLPCLLSDKITSECNITGLVEYLPLEATTDEWAEKLLTLASDKNRAENAEKAVLKIREAGFDITESAKILRNIYLSYSE